MNSISSDLPKKTSGGGLELPADRQIPASGAEDEKMQSSSVNRLRSRSRSRSRYLLVTTVVLVLALVGLAAWAAGQIGTAQASAKAAQAEAQEARATAQGAQATAQAAQADTSSAHASLVRSDARRLAAEADNLRLQGGPNELIALLSIRAVNLQFSPRATLRCPPRPSWLIPSGALPAILRG